MASTDPAPIPTKLVNLIHGFCGSQAIFTACELGIFEVLHVSDKPLSAKQLSQKLSTNLTATGRLLNVLVSLELLNKQTKDDEVFYENTEESKWLTTNSSLPSVAGFTKFHMQTSYSLIGNLIHAIRDGNSQWQRTFNETTEETFKCLYANKEKKINFLECMRGISKPGAPFFVSAFDLTRFKTMCDLGGGTGDVAYAACNKYPGMKITVLDIPAVVQCSSHFRPSKDECPNQHNVSFVEGDFFKGPLPTADLYVLTRILHDWGEEKIDIILSNIYNSLPSGGGVMIGELLLHNDKSGPLFHTTYDLIMLVICGKGARERSGQEYQELLEKHGFHQVQYKVTGTNSLDAVLAIKP